MANFGGARHDPPELRQAGYRKNFNFYTLFFDCYRLKSGGIRFVGPPPISLLKALKLSELSTDTSSAKVMDRNDLAMNRINKVFHMDLLEQNKSDILQLTIPHTPTFELTVQPNGEYLYDGKRVLMTMIKYDDLEWLKQWVEFYVKAHGVDAVLIYNNNAPKFTSYDVNNSLVDIPGLEVVGVIDWDFPYGAPAGPSDRFDSAFTQVGAMEHARHRFLGGAKCVINADVDELVFSHDPNETVCSLVEKAPTGHLTYHARWASGKNGYNHAIPPAQRRYCDSYCVNVLIREAGQKWAIVPSKCPTDSELSVHVVIGMENSPSLSKYICYRNMAEFNSGWKSDRLMEDGIFQLDETMERTFKEIGWL